MEFALPTAFAALALIVVVAMRARHHLAGRAQPVPVTPSAATIVLDVGEIDATSEGARRLAKEAAHRARLGSKEIGDVTVVTRAGSLLGFFPATDAHLPRAPYPLQLVEPHTRHSGGEPRPGLEGELHPTVIPGFQERAYREVKRPLIESFELPDVVLKEIRRPDDPLDIVRAILSAAGVRTTEEGDLIRSGDQVFVILPAPVGHALLPDALNHAYWRFRNSGAARGVVIGLGFMDPIEVRRRESLAPELRHSGPEAIQRMADAVSVGADPLAFAAGPAFVASIDRRAG